MTPEEELFQQIEDNQAALKTLIDDSARMAARSGVMIDYARAQRVPEDVGDDPA